MYFYLLFCNLWIKLDNGEQFDEINVKDAIYRISSAWANVKTKTIENCFRKCGFIIKSEVAEVEENIDENNEFLGIDLLFKEKFKLNLSIFEYARVDDSLIPICIIFL